MTHDNEMLPCPFCGGKAVIERMGTGRVSMQISCEDCGCFLETGETFLGPHCSWNTRTPPPPSCDAVRLAVEALEGYVSKTLGNLSAIEKAHIDPSSTFGKARDALEALRALPATPVNPPSAERVEALDDLKTLETLIYQLVEAFNMKMEYFAIEARAQTVGSNYSMELIRNIRAALSAPVDTGWIDEMRIADPYEYLSGDYGAGYNAALDAVKQKIGAGNDTGWLPIETAPRDGTWFVATCESSEGFDFFILARCQWDRGDWNWRYELNDPTYWMPLPAPPVKQKLDGRGS